MQEAVEDLPSEAAELCGLRWVKSSKQLISLWGFLLLNQNQSRHIDTVCVPQDITLLSPASYHSLYQSYVMLQNFIINLLANALVLTSEGVLECITLFSPICFFLTVRLYVFFSFPRNWTMIAADSWMLCPVIHKYCVQSVFVSPSL